MPSNYIEQSLILVSAITGIFSVSYFACLLNISISVAGSPVGL